VVWQRGRLLLTTLSPTYYLNGEIRCHHSREWDVYEKASIDIDEDVIFRDNHISDMTADGVGGITDLLLAPILAIFNR
jgi:hypothetical protein